jgi:cyclic pyranopterin phosphate synthase
MPAENVTFRPQHELLTFEEISQVVQAAAELGVTKLRLTGGEPLVRRDLPQLIERLVAIPGIQEVALTTNGILLAEQAVALRRAGLDRLNVSLDSLSEATFQKITRRAGLQQVLDGIFAARQAGFEKLRLNAIAVRGLTEAEILPLAEFARTHQFALRFIEFMPLDGDQQWQPSEVLTGGEIRQTLEAAFGPLVPVARDDLAQPALDYDFPDGAGRIGFINPVSAPFCHDCNRLRLTAEGQVRNCLFATSGWDARAVLRAAPGTDNAEPLRQLLRDCVAAKRPAHAIGAVDFQQPDKAMYQIGG